MKDQSSTGPALEKLLEQARQAALHSYSPYSGFRVGAALRLANGEVVTGTNVENVSYGLTICAERSALVRPFPNSDPGFASSRSGRESERRSQPALRRLPPGSGRVHPARSAGALPHRKRNAHNVLLRTAAAGLRDGKKALAAVAYLIALHQRRSNPTIEYAPAQGARQR